MGGTTILGKAAGTPEIECERRRIVVPGGQPLPLPFTEDIVAASLAELPDASRRATETFLKCFRESKFTCSDLATYMESISGQSITLRNVLSRASQRSTPTAARQAMHVTSSFFAPASARTLSARQPPSAQAMEDIRFEKTEEAVDMTSKLIERRRREVRRRQLSEFPGGEHQKLSNYLSSIIRRLAHQVPASGQAMVRDAIRSYVSHATSPEQFVESLQAIVDEFGVIIPLEYSPEHETRAHQPAGNHSNKRASSGQNQAPRKRAKVESVANTTVQAIHIDSSPSPPSSYASPAEEPTCYSAWKESVTASPAEVLLPDGPVSSKELRDTPLGSFLTSRAQAASFP